MANKYQNKVTSSLSNIEQSVKTFGPKMPTGDQDKQNETDEILDFTDVICGALLTFIFNKKYTKGAGLTQLARVAIGGANVSGTINNTLNSIKKSLTSNKQNSIPNLLNQINNSIIKLSNNTQSEEAASLNNNNRVFDINITGLTNDKSTKAFIDLITKIEKSKTDKFNESIKSFAEAFNSDGVMQDMINTINNVEITDKTMSNANKMIDVLKAFAELNNNKLAIAGAKSIDIYVKMAEGFVRLSEKLGDIDVKSIERASNAMKDIAVITVILTGVLILVGYVGGHLDYIGIGKFILALSLFELSLILIFNKKTTKGLAEANEGIKGLALLVTVCGAILIGATLVSDLIKFESLVTFISNLTGFVGGLLLVFKYLPTGGVKSALDGAGDVALLVGICGAVLIFASLAMKYIKPENLLLFSGTLLVFLIGLSLPLLAWGNIAPRALEGARDLALLVTICGAVLIAGSLFMYIIDVNNLLKFGTILLGFMFVLSVEVLIMGAFVRKAISGMEEFAILVAVSAGVLILGGTLLTYYPNLIPGMINFGLLLSLGLALIILPLNLFFNDIQLSIKSALGLSIVIGTVALVLCLGASYIMNDPRRIENALIFAGIVSGFLFVMGGIIFLLDKFVEDLGDAVLALLGLSIVTGIFAIIFYSVIQMDIEKHQNSIWLFLGMSTAFVGSMILLSVLTSFALPFIALGLIGIIGIDLSVFALIQIMKYIGDENKNINVDSIFGSNISELFSNFSLESLANVGKNLGKGFIGKALLFVLGMGGIAGLLTTLTLPMLGSIVAIGIMTINVALLSGSMMLAAYSLKQVNKVGDIDFEKILKFVGGFDLLAGALIGSFGNPLLTIPLLSVITTIGELCGTISIAATVIKDIAQFKIPVFSGTEIVSYRQLETTDFEKAANSISTIITTIGKALIDAYDEKMFDGSTWFTDSPFEKVVKQTSKMGTLISDISEAIKDYASLKIPVYEGTSIKEYRPITENDFTEAASNISKVITTIGFTLYGLYNGDFSSLNTILGSNFNISNKNGLKQMWNTEDGDSPMNRVLNASIKMGEVIGSISEGIQAYASLRIPIKWDSKGNPIDFKIMDRNKFFSEAATNIGLVITTMGTAIMDAYKGHKEWLNPTILRQIKDGWFEDEDKQVEGTTPLFRALVASKLLGDVISSIAKGVINFANGRIDEFDANGKKTGNTIPLKDYDFKSTKTLIYDVLTIMGKSIWDTYEKYKDTLFDEDNVKLIMDNILLMTTIISKLAANIKQFSQMKIQKYDANGHAIKDEFIILDQTAIKQSGQVIESILTSISNAFYTYSQSLLKDENAITNLDDLSKTTESFINNLEQIVDDTIKLNTILAKIDQLGDVEIIQDRLNKFATLLFGKTIVSKKIGIFNINVKRGGILNLIKQLSDYNNLVSPTVNLTNIGKTIEDVIKAFNKIKDTQKIQKFGEATDKFSKSVKSIDLGKLVLLKSIADDMAKMSEANAINNLLEVTNKFNKAVGELQKALKKEETLTDKRKKQIEENVKKINDLMEKEMTVILKPDIPQTPTTTPLGGQSEQHIDSHQTTSGQLTGNESTFNGGERATNGQGGGYNNTVKQPKLNNATSDKTLHDLSEAIGRLVNWLNDHTNS